MNRRPILKTDGKVTSLTVHSRCLSLNDIYTCVSLFISVPWMTHFPLMLLSFDITHCSLHSPVDGLHFATDTEALYEIDNSSNVRVRSVPELVAQETTGFLTVMWDRHKRWCLPSLCKSWGTNIRVFERVESV